MPSPPSVGNPNSGLRDRKEQDFLCATYICPLSHFYSSHHPVSFFVSLTVAFIQAETTIAEAEFSRPVGSGQARGDPSTVVPAAIRLGVHFQTGFNEVQLRLVEFLNIIFFSKKKSEKHTERNS